jgi:hypothetical protein
MYLAAHVPIVIFTDDQGIARIDTTNEFITAVTDSRVHLWRNQDGGSQQPAVFLPSG